MHNKFHVRGCVQSVPSSDEHYKILALLFRFGISFSMSAVIIIAVGKVESTNPIYGITQEKIFTFILIIIIFTRKRIYTKVESTKCVYRPKMPSLIGRTYNTLRLQQFAFIKSTKTNEATREEKKTNYIRHRNCATSNLYKYATGE